MALLDCFCPKQYPNKTLLLGFGNVSSHAMGCNVDTMTKRLELADCAGGENPISHSLVFRHHNPDHW